MRTWTSLRNNGRVALMSLSCTALASAGQGSAPQPDPRPRTAARGPVRLMVVTGGHSYPTSFYELFSGRPEWEWSHFTSNQEAFAEDRRESYDVVLFYDMSQELSQAGRANLRAFAESGKGIVVLHHALVSYQDWPWWYEELVAGRYLLAAVGAQAASTYQHDVELEVTPVGDHPVVRSLGTMHFVDETYKGMWLSPRVTPLLTIDHPSGDRCVAWVSPYEKARVVAIQLGHGPPAHRDPGFRELVRRAILWTAGSLEGPASAATGQQKR